MASKNTGAKSGVALRSGEAHVQNTKSAQKSINIKFLVTNMQLSISNTILEICFAINHCKKWT
jgi:hypothetical protein